MKYKVCGSVSVPFEIEVEAVGQDHAMLIVGGMSPKDLNIQVDERASVYADMAELSERAEAPDIFVAMLKCGYSVRMVLERDGSRSEIPLAPSPLGYSISRYKDLRAKGYTPYIIHNHLDVQVDPGVATTPEEVSRYLDRLLQRVVLRITPEQKTEK